MANVKAKVLNAVVDGKGEGEVVTIDEKSAKHLESIGYVKIQKAAAKAPQDPPQDPPKDTDDKK